MIGRFWALNGLGTFYYNLVLVFGTRSAPYIFNLFAEALHWILQRNIPAHIRHYLNDFLSIFAPDTPTSLVDSSLAWALELGIQLGLSFQPSKIVGPATSIEFLSLELDSLTMEVHLPAEKLKYLQELTFSWSFRKRCTQHDIDKLTGFLQFTSQVIPMSRAFLRSLYDFAASFPSTPQASRHISSAAQKDIEWWNFVAPNWNGVRFISPARRIIDVFTDASGKKGIEGYLGSEWFSARCPHCFRHAHIQVKEMLAVVHAILCWGNSFSGCHVVFHVDNRAVFHAICDKSICSLPTMKLVKHLIALAC